MSVLDTALLTELQGMLAETENAGASWSSGMWTADEVLGYLNESQQELLTGTALVLTRATIACTPHQLRHPLPARCIAVQRVAWVRAHDGRVFPLDPADTWQLDGGISDWRTNPGVPRCYDDSDTQSLTIQVAPAPSVNGTLRVTYLALPTDFTGGGVAAAVPDEVTPGILWRTLGRMLRKEGRAKDTIRADHCDQRFELVLEAVKILMRGWEAGG